MSTDNKNVFYYNGVTVPFFRICGFREDYNEDFSNDEDNRKTYPELKSDEKILNITLKISDSENHITNGDENISFPMPEKQYLKERKKYFSWLENHEKELIKNGHGTFINVAKNDIAETINKTTKESAELIKRTFDSQSDKLDNLIERLVKKEENLDSTIKSLREKENNLLEAHQSVIELIHSFNDNLTGFDLLKSEEEMKEKDQKLEVLTKNGNKAIEEKEVKSS